MTFLTQLYGKQPKEANMTGESTRRRLTEAEMMAEKHTRKYGTPVSVRHHGAGYLEYLIHPRSGGWAIPLRVHVNPNEPKPTKKKRK